MRKYITICILLLTIMLGCTPSKNYDLAITNAMLLDVKTGKVTDNQKIPLMFPLG